MRCILYRLSLVLAFLAEPSAAQVAKADGLLAVLFDLPFGGEGEVLAALDSRWPGSRRIGVGQGPVTEGDPLYWSAVFRTPGLEATPPHGLTLSCIRYGPESHRALIDRRADGLRPWPGGADARLFCEGQGVFWGRGVSPMLARGAQPVVEAWAVDRSRLPPVGMTYRGGDTAPRQGRMVRSFRMVSSPAGGTVPGEVFSVRVEIFDFEGG